MNSLTNEECIEFIENFKNWHYLEIKNNNTKIHKFYETISEISKSLSPSYDSLIDNSNKMFALDWIT